jgi:hypothetical protein
MLRRTSAILVTPVRAIAEDGSSDQHGARAEGDCLEDVRAAADTAIHENLELFVDRLHDLGQDVEGSLCPIELPSTVVRDDYRGGAVLDREPRILRGHDPFEDDGQRGYRAQPLQ